MDNENEIKLDGKIEDKKIDDTGIADIIKESLVVKNTNMFANTGNITKLVTNYKENKKLLEEKIDKSLYMAYISHFIFDLCKSMGNDCIIKYVFYADNIQEFTVYFYTETFIISENFLKSIKIKYKKIIDRVNLLKPMTEVKHEYAVHFKIFLENILEFVLEKSKSKDFKETKQMIEDIDIMVNAIKNFIENDGVVIDNNTLQDKKKVYDNKFNDIFNIALLSNNSLVKEDEKKKRINEMISRNKPYYRTINHIVKDSNDIVNDLDLDRFMLEFHDVIHINDIKNPNKQKIYDLYLNMINNDTFNKYYNKANPIVI